jgi:hypothetical protein
MLFWRIGALSVFVFSLLNTFQLSDALALSRFRCGVNRVAGKLFLSGVTAKDKTGIDLTLKRAPLLVIWSGTLSETAIPLRLSEGLRERIAGTGAEPLSAEFDVEIFKEEAKPEVGELLAYRPLEGGQLDGSKSAQARVIKPEGCRAITLIPEPK